ncbi:MAG: hypothetical protein ACO3MW_05855 [Rhodospirillales bacterium]|jgi:hypothetical protein
MTRYFVNRRTTGANGQVLAAFSFLLVASAMFLSTVISQFSPVWKE